MSDFGLRDDESFWVVYNSREVIAEVPNFVADIIVEVSILTLSSFEKVESVLKVGLVFDNAGFHELYAPADQWNLGTVKEGEERKMRAFWL